MSAAIRIIDETATGQALSEQRLELHLVSERISARELIARRVQMEVRRFNDGGRYNGLVQPKEHETALNAARPTLRRLDPAEQTAVAIDAFERGKFLLFVGDAQIEGADEPVVLEDATVVRFVKLVPLVGG